MAASAFLVVLDPEEGGHVLNDKKDAVVCWAEDAAQAKGIAKASMVNDSNASWDNATATALVTGTELEGWVFTITLRDPLTPFTELSVSVTGANGNAVDDIGAALVTALNATVIDAAAYVAGTNTLTIVDVADGMGDWVITANAYPPTALGSSGLFPDNAVAIPSVFGAITAAGAAGIARTSVLAAALPVLYGKLRSSN